MFNLKILKYSFFCLMSTLIINQSVFGQSIVSFNQAISKKEATVSDASFSDASFISQNIDKEDILKQFKNVNNSLAQRNLIGTFTATAYDTYSGSTTTAIGLDLSGKTLEEVKVIATDPKVIPLGSEVYVEFPEPYTYLNDYYLAADTGGSINGNIIDVFWGDYGKGVHDDSIWEFGRRKGVKVYSLY